MEVYRSSSTSALGDLMGLTILLYDHFLTFPVEVHYFWRKLRCNLGLALFFVNRYTALCLHLFNVTRIFIPLYIKVQANSGRFSCSNLQTVERTGVVLTQLFCSAIMTMRVYALYGKSRFIMLSLSAFIAGVLGFGIWALFLDPAGTGNNILACTVTDGAALHMAIVWSGQVIFDVVIFVLTVWKSYRIGRVGKRVLVDVLLRDGSMYFAIITGVNAANIALLVLAPHAFKSTAGTFPNALNVVLVSRLVLNLQESNRRADSVLEAAADGPLTMTTVIPLGDVTMSMRIDAQDIWPPQRPRGSNTLEVSNNGERLGV